LGFSFRCSSLLNAAAAAAVDTTFEVVLLLQGTCGAEPAWLMLVFIRGVDCERTIGLGCSAKCTIVLPVLEVLLIGDTPASTSTPKALDKDVVGNEDGEGGEDDEEDEERGEGKVELNTDLN